MATKTIQTELFMKMFLAGTANLEAKKEWINDLNVFPVPDGDTGTNMCLTLVAATKEINGLDNPDMETAARAISSGSLRGARGNSGVILSQLLRGFNKVIREESEIDANLLAKACERAAATAYKAVMKPKEGTILTVARGIADKAIELAESTDDLEVILPALIEHGNFVLSKTPDMLPVLKEAGVVDSGGQGLMEILQGAYDAFLGKEIDYSSLKIESSSDLTAKPEFSSLAEIIFGYCTEFLIFTEREFTKKNEQDFISFLESMGDSIVCVTDDGIVKIHVHTNDPGLVLQRALSFGEISGIKIDNMWEEHREMVGKDEKKKDEPLKKVGFVAVSIGEGMNSIFNELGVDYIIQGGQTMNPSTDDMIYATQQVNAESIFILPNNKNIILAADQAKHLVKDKNIIVVQTTTIPQGISAIISYMPEAELETNLKAMNEAIEIVKTGQVTYAVRDTTIDDKIIKEGDIMGLNDDGICAVGQCIHTTTKEMLEIMVDEDTELISVYYGEDVSEEDALSFTEEVEGLYPQADVDTHYGGQPIYYYVVSVE